jgi:hypothetical protein
MKVMVVVTLLAAVACGGSDEANSFDTSGMTGTWTGVSTITANGQAAGTNNLRLTVSANGNDVTINNICGGGVGIPATVTSPTQFTIKAKACPPVSSTTGCSSVTLALANGTGTAENNTLTIGASGSLSGCGNSFPLTLSFNGTR